jgi:hypothetical protein
MASRKANARAISPRTWAASSGFPGAGAKASATWPAGLVPCPAAGAVPLEAGLGARAGVISGNRLAAFPAPIRVVLVTFRRGMGPGMAPGAMAGKRLAAFPAPMSLLVALFRFGRGTAGRVGPCRDVPAGLAEPFGEALADGLAEAERVVPALALGDAEWVGLALGVGLPDAERVGLAVGVGVGDVELAVGVGVGDVEGVGLALAVGVGVDVDDEGECDADVDGDGLAVLEPPVLELVLAAAEEGDGEGGDRAREGGIWRADRQRRDEETSNHDAGYHRPAVRKRHVTPLSLLLMRVGT